LLDDIGGEPIVGCISRRRLNAGKRHDFLANPLPPWRLHRWLGAVFWI
jgi:hypothetical protein